MGFNNIRYLEGRVSKSKRLTARMQSLLNDIDRELQKRIYVMTIKEDIQAHILFSYLGHAHRVRGSSSWNNYCEFSQEAHIAFKSCQTAGDAVKELSKKWNVLSSEEQDRYNDDDYLKTLQSRKQSKSRSTSSTELVADETHSSSVAQSSQKTMNKKLPMDRVSLAARYNTCNEWAKKTIGQLKSFADSHQVEGFLVVASKDPTSSIAIIGGTHSGEHSLDLLAKSPDDPNSLFQGWVVGRAARCKLLGNANEIEDLPASTIASNRNKRKRATDEESRRHPYDRGNFKENLKEVRRQLGYMIWDASGGGFAQGWPGNTASAFKRANLTLCVQENNLRVTPKLLMQPLTKLVLVKT